MILVTENFSPQQQLAAIEVLGAGGFSFMESERFVASVRGG